MEGGGGWGGGVYAALETTMLSSEDSQLNQDFDVRSLYGLCFKGNLYRFYLFSIMMRPVYRLFKAASFIQCPYIFPSS